MKKMKLLAKTFLGLEEVLSKELQQLGAEDIEIANRAVSFTGDKEMLYRANFELRTAIRILKPIATFKATTADEVYEEIKKIDWTQYLTITTTFAVDSVVYSEEFRNSKFVSYKVKDAIVDYFREKEGNRPNICITAPDIRFNMHISGKDCTLSLDSSGESLHKRGYRQATVESPINEILAAAMVLMSGWQGECDLIDPMCGSGTILIEAGLIARNIAPGVFRQNYAFEKWPDFDKELFEQIYNDDSKERNFEHHIYGYDIEGSAVNAALQNVKAAGLSNEVSVQVQSFQKFTQPEQKSLIIMNPPYGERISSPNLLGLYRTIGDKLKHQFSGNDAWIIGYKEETFASIGLKPSLKISLYNGSLPCEYRKYTMFDGQLGNFRSNGGVVKTDVERKQNAQRKIIKPKHDATVSRDMDYDSEIPEYMIRRHNEFIKSQRKEERSHRMEANSERSSRRDDYRSDRDERKSYKRDSKRENSSFDNIDNRFKGHGQRENDNRRFKGTDNRGAFKSNERRGSFDSTSRFSKKKSFNHAKN